MTIQDLIELMNVNPPKKARDIIIAYKGKEYLIRKMNKDYNINFAQAWEKTHSGSGLAFDDLLKSEISLIQHTTRLTINDTLVALIK